MFLVPPHQGYCFFAPPFLPIMSRERDTATEAAEAGANGHEQKTFDLESSAISTISSAHAAHAAHSAHAAHPHPHIHEGYGFRPSSGASTPQIDGTYERPVKGPIPDAYGLGWPGLSVVFPLRSI